MKGMIRTMKKDELFTYALSNKRDFEAYKQEDLVEIGRFLGGDHIVFKDVYKAYLDKKSVYENDPMIGEKVEIIFDWKNEEVVFSMQEIKLKFVIEAFLSYLSLIDTCFLELYPLGSVIELELDMMPERVRRVYKDSDAFVSISGRKVSMGDEDKYFVDYIGRVWPFGEGALTPPIFLSKAMIKRVVFTGMIDEAEEEYADKVLRLEVINSRRKSINYLTDNEQKEIENVF